MLGKLPFFFQVETDLQYIKEDIHAVEKHRVELYRARERYSVKLRMLLDDPVTSKLWPSSVDRHNNVLVSSARSPHGAACSGLFLGKKVDMKVPGSYSSQPKKDVFNGSDTQLSLTQSGLIVARKRRIHAQVSFMTFVLYNVEYYSCARFIMVLTLL